MVGVFENNKERVIENRYGFFKRNLMFFFKLSAAFDLLHSKLLKIKLSLPWLFIS